MSENDHLAPDHLLVIARLDFAKRRARKPHQYRLFTSDSAFFKEIPYVDSSWPDLVRRGIGGVVSIIGVATSGRRRAFWYARFAVRVANGS